MDKLPTYENFGCERHNFYWIIDGEKEIEVHTSDGKLYTTLPRYAVVDQKQRRGKGQVIDQSNDLEDLIRKYDVSNDEIYDTKGNKINR